MPQLEAKGLTKIVKEALIWAVIRTAQREELGPEAIDFFVNYLEALAEPVSSRTICRIRFNGSRSMQFRVNNEEMHHGGDLTMLVGIGSNTSLRAELHHFRMEQLYPKRIKQCIVEHSVERNENIVCVIFVNGHKVVRPESETTSAEFVALCGMLYDLPELNGPDA